jgi:exosortase/archaeosortase family protein
VLFAIYCFPYAESGLAEAFFRAYLNGYASLIGRLLGLVEPAVQVIDNRIIGRTSLQIVKSCDAMEANILFAAALFAFPGARTRKLLALGSGLAVIAALNVLRIGSLYFVALHLPGSFELFHLELWPLVMIAATLVLSLSCAVWMKPHGATA